jgi:hypothetical protein
VTHKQVVKLGGGSLLRRYKSLEAALMAAYPEYNWQPMRFQTRSHTGTPHQFKTDRDSLIADLKTVEHKLGITDVCHMPDPHHFFSPTMILSAKGLVLDDSRGLETMRCASQV